MSTKKTKIIYVASNGRSGSTLLEMMLAANKNIITLGEIQRLVIDHDNYQGINHKKVAAQPCGCGEALNECDFWKGIVSTLKESADAERIGVFRSFPDVQGKAIRLKELLRLRNLAHKNSTETPAEIEQYNNANVAMFREVEKKLGTDSDENMYFIDSSKDPYRLAWLSRSSAIDIKVLHIVKECPPYIYSMIKSEKSWLKRHLLFCNKVGRWVIENALILWVCKLFFDEDSYKTVRYEELATKPKETISALCKWLEVESENDMAGDFRKPQHAISGNAMRRDDKPIVLDEEWKQKLDKPLSWVARLTQKLFASLVYKHEAK